jgi:hypothetical protein
VRLPVPDDPSEWIALQLRAQPGRRPGLPARFPQVGRPGLVLAQGKSLTKTPGVGIFQAEAEIHLHDTKASGRIHMVD